MILGFYGRKGSGKTTFQTAFGQDAVYHKVPLDSNYPLKLKHEDVEMVDYLDYMETNPKRIIGHMFLWDEAYTDAHGRRGHTQLNIDSGNLAFQSRHLRFDLLYSIIKFTSLENSLREASDMTIVCQAVPPFGKPNIFIFRFCLPPEIALHNIIGLDDYEVIRTVMTYADAWGPIWQLFDTHRIKSLRMAEEKRIEYNEKKKMLKEAIIKKVRGELLPPDKQKKAEFKTENPTKEFPQEVVKEALKKNPLDKMKLDDMELDKDIFDVVRGERK